MDEWRAIYVEAVVATDQGWSAQRQHDDGGVRKEGLKFTGAGSYLDNE